MIRRHALPAATAGLIAGILLGRAAPIGWPAWIGLACAAAAFALLKGRVRLAALCCAALCLGAGLGWHAYHPALPEERDYAVTGVVAEDIRVDGDHVRTVLRSVALDGAPLPGGAYWSFYGEVPADLTPGSRVSLTASLYHPGGASNPGGYDFREALLQKNVPVGLYGSTGLSVSPWTWNLWSVSAALRDRMQRGLVSAMGPEAGGYASAMLLGLRDQIEQEDVAAFRRLGIAHVLAVSGYHTGVLAALALGLLKLLRAGRKTRAAALAVVLGAYCLLTGLNAPVVRATLLVLLSQIAGLRRRRAFLPYLLCLGCCVQLLIQPALVTSAGFHLSYGAMLGLALVTPWLLRLRRFAGKLSRAVWNAISASLGAQLGILLPELYWFQKLPLLGLILNLVVFTVFSVVLAAMWATLFLLPVPALAGLTGKAAAFLMHLLLRGIRWMDAHAAVELWTKQANLLTLAAWALLLFACSLWWRRKGRVAALALGGILLTVSLIPWPHPGSEYTQFSVGSADAAVLWDRDDVTVIDTGEDGYTVGTWLRQRRLGVSRLILTHLHRDHAGGVTALLDEGIPIAECLIPWGAEDALIDPAVAEQLTVLRERGVPVRSLGRGDLLPLPGGGMTVLWPETGRVRPGQDANESSLTLRAEVNGTTLLLTGDLDGRYELYAAAPADILKVAHHGSKASTSPAFLEAVAPETLIVSCGDAARARGMADRAGDIPLYVTREDGALIITLEENGYAVTPFARRARPEQSGQSD